MARPIRVQRIAERIREELSEILLYQVTDPRLKGVSVTDVTVDRELAYATIFVSTVEGSVREDEVLSGFEHAAGFIRFQLSQRIELRSFPQVRFKWDPTAERAERLEELFARLREEKEAEDRGDDD
ncbi:MAG TPA: 30S ribosome-binding factor RbfA [Anaerolineales bacterium]|nr:30S ribosome-binding factor RbfA [Anaerolineales bacterium]